MKMTPAEILTLPPEERPPALKMARETPYSRIIVDPPLTDEEKDQHNGGLVGNVSLDLELGDVIKVTRFPGWDDGKESLPEDLVIDLDDPGSFERAEEHDVFYRLEEGKKYRLEPGTFVRAYTRRYFFLPNDLMGWVEGRSKLARIGVTATVTAPKVDPGFSGRIVLEMAHLGRIPLNLSVGAKVGQMMFFTVEGKIGEPYDTLHTESYQRQEGVHYLCEPMSFEERREVVARGITPLIYEVEEKL